MRHSRKYLNYCKIKYFQQLLYPTFLRQTITISISSQLDIVAKSPRNGIVMNKTNELHSATHIVERSYKELLSFDNFKITFK